SGARILFFATRTDSTIACWGNNSDNRADPPPGKYTSIAAGDWHSCAIRTDSTIACWGFKEDDGQADAPPGLFAAVAAGTWHSCAIRADGTIACWGQESSIEPPRGQFIAVPPKAAQPAESA
ncbi:MAG: hypothetical protein F4153_11280, partial [Acidimicrobiia bacterium]|nr:hypothetical protein [Acidimicrobiia bacterium]